MTSQAALSAASSGSSSSNKRLLSRRVPDGKRQRTLVSCDRCKQRRMKCSRSEPDAPCLNCSQQGLECTSALPRKHRITAASRASLGDTVRSRRSCAASPAKTFRRQNPSLRSPAATTSTCRASNAANTSHVRLRTIPSLRSRLTPVQTLHQSHALPAPTIDSAAALLPCVLRVRPQSCPSTFPTASSYQLLMASRTTLVRPARLNLPMLFAASWPRSIVSIRPVPPPCKHLLRPACFQYSLCRRYPIRAACIVGLQSNASVRLGSHHHPKAANRVCHKYANQQGTRARDRTHPAAAAAAVDDSASSESDDQVEHVASDRDPQSSSIGIGPTPSPATAGNDPSSGLMSYNVAAPPIPATTSTNPTESIHANNQISDLATPDSTKSIRTRRLRDLLPAKAVSDRLVDAFFDRVHPNYVVFHRGLFHRRYRSIWRPNDRENDPSSRSAAKDGDAGWICSLLMVLVFGAQALEGQGLPGALQIQRRYLRLVVRERFQRLTFTASLSNVQALLLLQLYEHNAGERNAAWMLLGQAARMAIALGMHRETHDPGLDTVEQNLRRLVWWTLQQFEMNLSMALGRPSTLELVEVTARVPEEAIMDRNDFPTDYRNTIAGSSAFPGVPNSSLPALRPGTATSRSSSNVSRSHKRCSVSSTRGMRSFHPNYLRTGRLPCHASAGRCYCCSSTSTTFAQHWHVPSFCARSNAKSNRRKISDHQSPPP